MVRWWHHERLLLVERRPRRATDPGGRRKAGGARRRAAGGSQPAVAAPLGTTQGTCGSHRPKSVRLSIGAQETLQGARCTKPSM